MPWQSSSGNIYKLCLLDTNVLSEITKQPSHEGLGFIEKYRPEFFAPCLTVYNLIELKRKQPLFEAFVTLFENYPIFLLKPYMELISQQFTSENIIESENVLLNAFVPNRRSTSYDLRNFLKLLFNDPVILNVEQSWRHEEYATLKEWLINKKNFLPESPDSNKKDADRYIKVFGPSALIAHGILKPTGASSPTIDNFPSLKIALYSIYYRLYNPHWKPEPQEVTDVKIAAAVPFVDVIITEVFQANIFRKINKKVVGLSKLEISTLKDIRAGNHRS